ncbi:hypothetical protein SLEP1_g9306 [Rubroshorea leprosula]|uniref:Uncharacterized protein n=1 Tax=Rubroshorea leprosula TaxID=152421 RepID=A0AAV5IFH7_9ROSI|nr:hypothetical protein SLEP1_g9306 [Rubroshorea leprosula]
MYNGIGFVDLTKKPNRDILDHDCTHQIELKLVVMEDKLTKWKRGFKERSHCDRVRGKLEEKRTSIQVTVRIRHLETCLGSSWIVKWMVRGKWTQI